jgi:hypothetical protein
MMCEECGVEIIIRQPRDERKRFCTSSCSLYFLHRTKQVPYGNTKNKHFPKTHGLAANGGTAEYRAWKRMKQRCTDDDYYVQQGICVCDEWVNDPVAFVTYVLNKLGPYPGRGWSLDRLDNERGYEPGNIRWATVMQQRHNQRRWIERHYVSE